MVDKKEEQKPMRAVKRVTVEQVVEAEAGKIHLDGIIIAGKKYTLDIHNHCSKEGEERLDLDFNDGGYTLIIEKDGIRFSRTVYRRNHDHNDEQYLVVGIDNKVMGVKKGQTLWYSRFPHKSEGRDFFRVEFGAVEVDY